jgi:hypothetical protein
MTKFKDENNRVHDPKMEEAEGLAFLKKVHPEKSFTSITDEDAIILTTPTLTPQEISDNNSAQVEEELGGGKIYALVETFLEVINDGSIATSTTNEIIAKAKVKRLSGL